MSDGLWNMLPQALLMTAFFIAMALKEAVDARTKKRLRFGVEPAKRVELDEGGLRWWDGEARGYLPFRAIDDVSHAGELDAPVIEVKTANETLRLHTGGMPEDTFINAILTRKPVVEDALTPFLKNGRQFATWLAEAHAAHEMGSADAYRSSGRPTDDLVAIARNRAADAEVRAAAAHIAVRTDREGVKGLVESFGPRTPPLVVVAAAVARREPVDTELLEEALRC